MDKEQLITFAAKELISQANLDVINEVFSTDYIAHSGDKKYQGHDFLKRWTKQMHSAIQDITVDQILFLSQDEQNITWQRTLTGRHVNNLRGIPATNKKVTWTEIVVSRFENNKIIEEWVVSELAGELMLKQQKK
ncbi:ester cyclase [Seonamhaeicola sp.]|uniref:ester cyclase n=1 Tax=Seonamhaeicola sp. TaxID=1912245 RepID=UPI0026392CC6|nr:ester cyclase [Seonamhaeicola sp.]